MNKRQSNLHHLHLKWIANQLMTRKVINILYQIVNAQS
nr:MAG TPA: hypothetical protein [Caudoviricetes sp.]